MCDHVISYEEIQQDAEALAPYEFRLGPSEPGSPESEACFLLNLPGHPACVTPVSIGSMVVAHLRAMAHAFVGHNQVGYHTVACMEGISDALHTD